MMNTFISSDLLSQLVLGGLGIATGCVSYFARKIMKNQQDLNELKHMIMDLRKDSKLAHKEIHDAHLQLDHFEKSQEDAHTEITKELSRMSAITEICRVKWDREERRRF